MAYYLSLLRVHQVHAKQDTPMKGIISCIVIMVLIWKCKSLAATIISSMIATKV
jgi:branched-subunit amino acid transport protein